MKHRLSKFLPPALKSLLKETLQAGGRFCKSQVTHGIRILASDEYQIFFGYYDVSPLDAAGTLLLALRAPAQNISPHGGHPELGTGYFDLNEDSPQFRSIGQTATWNWQQGCRLQWFDKDSVLYNTESGAVVQDIHGKTIKIFSKNIYALDHQRHYGLSLDFARLHQYRRGYGYSNVPATGEGVTRVDLKTGEIKEILALETIEKFQPVAGMETAHHYINHLAFNPSGTRFMLFHVWTDGGPERSVRLLTAAPDGSGLYSPCPYIKPSHYSWMDDERLLITGTRDGKVVYLTVHDKTLDVEIVESAALMQDGHPSVLKDGTIISDTYPDILGRQKVFLYDPQSGKTKTLAVFHSPNGFSGEMRCDTHPRVSPDQKTICVDIVQHGRRALALIPMRLA